MPDESYHYSAFSFHSFCFLALLIQRLPHVRFALFVHLFFFFLFFPFFFAVVVSIMFVFHRVFHRRVETFARTRELLTHAQ